VVLDRPPHRTYEILLVIGMQESQHFQRLMFAVALFTFESAEILHADVAKFSVALTQACHLFFMVTRRLMRRIATSLS
jgi:hypothetical protein